MSQLRRDILTGEWVIFASNRRRKPYHFAMKTTPKKEIGNKDCPFCPGNEDKTPDQIYQNGADGKWNLRVFRNLYPAVDTDSFEKCNEDFYYSEAGIGIHEVLVDTPDHNGDPSQFSEEHMYNILKVLQHRFRVIEDEEFIKYVQIFKNNGPEAGASIDHSHWQIMGVSVVPLEQEKTLRNIMEYRNEKGGCVVCDMVNYEINNKTRIVAENQSFVAFVPYAAKLSFELWVVSKKHVSTFSKLRDDDLKDLGIILKQLLKRVAELRDGICYNLCFEDSPKGRSDEDFHWYMRILPRIGAPAGFEFATGSYINPMLPETAAQKYRSNEDWSK